MVGIGGDRYDPAKHRLPVFGTEQMVDTYHDGVAAKTSPYPTACFSETICQSGAYPAGRITDRSIVEIAANNNTLAFMRGNLAGHCVGHQRTACRSSAKSTDYGRETARTVVRYYQTMHSITIQTALRISQSDA